VAPLRVLLDDGIAPGLAREVEEVRNSAALGDPLHVVRVVEVAGVRGLLAEARIAIGKTSSTSTFTS